MLIIIPLNGLLNRIRAIVSAKLLADKFRTKLIILWFQENSCKCNYEDIFIDNSHLWKGIISSDIDSFIEDNKLPLKVRTYLTQNDTWKTELTTPEFLTENNNFCTLRGYVKGEQYFMNDFIKSKCMTKIIVAGGRFHDPLMGEIEFANKKSDIYKEIKFNDIIIRNTPTISKNTLGIHLRFILWPGTLPNINQVLSAIEKIIKKTQVHQIIIVSDDLEKKHALQQFLTLKYPNIQIIESLIKTSCRVSKLGLQLAMSDWLTLCKCENLIFCEGSSFGYEAFIYNYHNKNVCEIPNNKLLKKPFI
tara:strand:+ start:851 stop:1765 length:915 start_codon:yes stop_codon:yes gene_type:complete